MKNNEIETIKLVETQMDEEISVFDSLGNRVVLIKAFTNNVFNIVRLEVQFWSDVKDDKDVLKKVINYDRLTFIVQMMMFKHKKHAVSNIFDMIYDQVRAIDYISDFKVYRHFKNDIGDVKGGIPLEKEEVDVDLLRYEPTATTTSMDFAKIIVKYYKGKSARVWEFRAIDKEGKEIPNYPLPSKECAGNVIFEFSHKGDFMIDQYGRSYEVKKVTE